MLTFLVGLHSLLRWVVLLVVLVALVKGLLGWLGGGAWTGLDRGLTLAAVATVTLQALLGIVVWLARGWWAEGGFRGLTHPLVMLLALGVVHLGSARVGRAAGARDKYRTLTLSLLLAMFLITAAIPPDSWSRAWVG